MTQESYRKREWDREYSRKHDYWKFGPLNTHARINFNFTLDKIINYLLGDDNI